MYLTHFEDFENLSQKHSMKGYFIICLVYILIIFTQNSEKRIHFKKFYSSNLAPLNWPPNTNMAVLIGVFIEDFFELCYERRHK